MADTIGIGLVGCGNIALLHTASLARIASDGVPIRAVAAADPSPDAIGAAMANWAFERTSPHPADVLADPEVDAVFVCTPTATHRDLYLGVLEAGKHLYAEKPLAPSFGVVREMAAAATAAPVVTQVGFQMRRHSLLTWVRDVALRGELGPPMAYLLRDDEAFPTTEVNPYSSDWRRHAVHAGGGTLLEHTIHGIDVLQWLFGPADRVAATTRHTLGFDVEDTAALMVEHHSGVTGTVVSVYGGVRGREESRLEVFFRDGVVEVTWGVLVDGPESSLRVQRADEPPEAIPVRDVITAHLDTLGVRLRPYFWTELADRAFVDSVTSGTAASPGFADGLAAHATVEAAYRSAAAGEVVRVADVLTGP